MKKIYSRREFVKQNSLIGLGAAMPFGLTASFYDKLSDDLGKTWSNSVLCQNWTNVPLNDHVFEEPSVVYFRGKYYMTIRHDLRTYVTSSEDGLHYGELNNGVFWNRG